MTATLDASLAPPRAAAAGVARAHGRARGDAARARIARVVYETRGFVDYFRAATPEASWRTDHRQPARAAPAAGGGVETLRAIPWVFAWTQTRLLLPSWLGVGEALDERAQRGERDELARDVRGVAVLPVDARSDRDGAGQGRRRGSRRTTIACSCRRRCSRSAPTCAAGCRRPRPPCCASPGRRELLDDNPVLRRSIDVRNPYVDPINLVQVELLRRLRQSGGDERLRNAFLVTVNGVAAGMRNTG